MDESAVPCRRPLKPIDVVVITGILLLLAALAIPAIRMQQERARTQTCESRLKSLGAALLNYHDSHKMFPPGILSCRMDPDNRRHGKGYQGLTFYVAQSERCEDPGVPQVSGLTLLLPYLREREVAEIYNYSLACCAIQNATAASAKVESFLCPSNKRDGDIRVELPYYSRPQGFTRSLGVTDFGFSIGGSGLLIDDYERLRVSGGAGRMRGVGVMRRGLGAFNISDAVSINMIKDGVKNTFLMGETAGGRPVGLRADGEVVKGDEKLQRGTTHLTVETPWSQGFLGGPPAYKGGLLQGNPGGFGSVFAATAWNAWYDKGNLAPTEE